MTQDESSDSRNATISQLIAQFLSDETPDTLGLREIARRTNVLPVVLDMGGCLALRPSGEIVSFPWDNASDIRVETCPRIRNLAFFQGSKKFPALRALVPARPSNAVDCSHCRGQSELVGLPENVVCYCGGLGWLTPDMPSL